ncbi:hypothetical protein [Pleionea litopenaei]|uniref:Uncharacterized protein n=1 Tax=Pleionea litopenaei TaxID=3070815 RepID=A0AA51X8G6_9GAMM|nr:hypothetical protein [Pleionea sp. HL-JVS1]WMS89288.1 hypothetical protein Q9312_19325 [Pleionea sp. HL-JVS1]WMS89309.1 hypothetical protein Q9312_19215 [Pleionea sp. HL-JVS1]
MYELWRFSIQQGEKQLINLSFEEAESFCDSLKKPFRLSAKWVDDVGIGEFKGAYTDNDTSLEDWLLGIKNKLARNPEKGVNIEITVNK